MSAPSHLASFVLAGLALAAAAVAIAAVLALAETRREPTAAAAGRPLYDRDCGICHGTRLLAYIKSRWPAQLRICQS